jgi:hypothetical protein
MVSIDDEWDCFLNDKIDTKLVKDTKLLTKEDVEDVPVCEDLYISTTTKVLFLNIPIDIDNVFWKLPVIPYGNAESGIVKKQMKIISKTQAEYDIYTNRLINIPYYNEHIIKQIHNPTARRIKFKDERKITIGISKKDIMNYRGKVKNAFYNCFALIIRFKYNDIFKEIHIKVFNTGKLEIPGVLNIDLLVQIKSVLMDFLQPYITEKLYYVEKDIEDNVLINSNFKCGYFLNRDILYGILRSNKYGIETSYDPCSYPGVKCKFYFNNHNPFDYSLQKGLIEEKDRNMKLYQLDDNKKYTEVSFMIFRTGSCLIVGNCTEKILRFVYEFIKIILHNEYHQICVPCDIEPVKVKKEKIRKKWITVVEE